MTTHSTIGRFRSTAIVVFVLLCGVAFADDKAGEMSVKAAIAHKIAKFVTWPDSRFADDNPFLRICVLGDQMTLDAFEIVAKRPIHGRELRVLAAPEPLLVARSCDVLYMGGNDERDASEWLGSVAGQPVLTFAEAGRYASDGTIVTMTIRRNRVSFSINLKANENTGLRISAQLLQLAASVGSPGGM